MEMIIQRLEKTPEFEKFKPMIDYMLADSFGKDRGREITRYTFNFVATIDYPNCEGIYISCWLWGDFDTSDQKKIDMGTIKTLEDSKEALLLMGELTGLVIWVAGEVLQEQMNRGYFEQ